jgi:hypothetical protein
MKNKGRFPPFLMRLHGLQLIDTLLSKIGKITFHVRGLEVGNTTWCGSDRASNNMPECYHLVQSAEMAHTDHRQATTQRQSHKVSSGSPTTHAYMQRPFGRS